MKNLFVISIVGALCANGQERLSVPFRDPSMPRQVVVEGWVGSVQVTGYNGQEVVVESTRTEPLRSRAGRPQTPVPPGMRRIGGSGAGLSVTEENNVVRVSTGFFIGKADIKMQVPVQTSVRVTATGGGQVSFENVNGEIEVQNGGGDVNLTNVSGSVVASSMNGKVTVSLNNVTPDKPMSFSTMSGDIDVTLPATTKANLKMKTNNGDIFTDFDVQINPPARNAKADTRVRDFPFLIGGGHGTGFVLHGDGVFGGEATSATINGGGPEIQFTSFHGNILIHKK